MKFYKITFFFFLIYCTYTYSQENQIPQEKEAVFKKEILRDFKKKYRVKRFKKKNIDIVLIYWISLKDDKLVCDKKTFFQNIRYNTGVLQPIKVNYINKKEDIVLSAIIFKNENTLSHYSEGKMFFYPDVHSQSLLDVINKKNIKRIYCLVNFNKHFPYVLINSKNDIFIYYDAFIDEDTYKVLSCGEYLNKINN